MPEIQQVLFEWGDPGDGTQQVIYVGKAAIGFDVDSPEWQIKKFFYSLAGGSSQVSEIKTLNGKSWTDRAAYAW